MKTADIIDAIITPIGKFKGSLSDMRADDLALYVIRAWGLKDDGQRINPNGGAIALMHPFGMSVTGIIKTAVEEHHVQNRQYALAAL
jgi:acetyl-CoA acetyltransferase